jgi:leader peptidase (prepilin peptidase)/N-methyltransferase
VVLALLIALPALLTVPAMRGLVGRFGPVDGEPPRREIPSTAAFAAVTAVVVAAVAVAVHRHLAWLPAYLYLAVAGVVLAVIDIRVHRLPDRIVLPSYPVLAALFGVAALVDGDGGRWLRGVLAAAGVWLLFAVAALLPGGGLGRGDVKLSGLLAGALGWLGAGSVVVGFAAGIAIAGLWAGALLISGRAGPHDRIAYGPHLLLGTLLAVLAGAGSAGP